MIKHYSIFIRPISIIAHLIIVNAIFYHFGYYDDVFFVAFLNIAWLVTGVFSKIYFFHRTITVTSVVRQLSIHFAIFALIVLSYYAIEHKALDLKQAKLLLLYIVLSVTLFRSVYFTALRRYRVGGKNYRRVVLLGSNKSLKPLANFMMNRSDFGYKIIGYFSDLMNPKLSYEEPADRAFFKKPNGDIPFLGTTEDLKTFVEQNKIDEIYCSLSETDDQTLKQIIDIGDKKVISIKLVPDSKDVLTKNLKLEYYGFVPVFSMRSFPLERPLARYSKRLFDIIFSLFVIVFVMSWLLPILFILIKLDSKGPLFFNQKREGLKGETFTCYKFRSMTPNSRSDYDQTVKNDHRITRVGKFIRKTSLDELPQFFNVLIGNMSVVGPRPHMPNQSKIFKSVVDKYMVRHFIKPGITGLAQVRGYRGEIETEKDIIQRINSDIFYLENWSFVMDINIILKTFIKMILGDDKAY